MSEEGSLDRAEQANVRVMLVEDDDFTRVTLAAALKSHGVEVVAAVSDAKTAIKEAVECGAQVGVFDLDLGPGPTGIDAALGVRRLIPDFGIVMLTSYEDPRLFSLSLKSLPHPSAYVVKQSLQDFGYLVAAIRGSIEGGQEFTVSQVDLTDAQVETLRLVACGLSNAEIAKVRVVEEKSVEQTVARTAKRIGIPADTSVNKRVALARAFYQLIGAKPLDDQRAPGHP